METYIKENILTFINIESSPVLRSLCNTTRFSPGQEAGSQVRESRQGRWGKSRVSDSVSQFAIQYNEEENNLTSYFRSTQSKLGTK